MEAGGTVEAVSPNVAPRKAGRASQHRGSTVGEEDA
jgi:hypothetical protein